MRIETLKTLLGGEALPGTPEELTILATRIEELMRLNGREWIIRHRRKLVREWAYIIEQSLLRHP
jgi:hypothetical protein